MLSSKWSFIFFFCFFSQMAWAEGLFTIDDLLGDGSLCSMIKANKESGIEICSPYIEASVNDLSASAGALDDHLAYAELRRNITLMSESQIQSSLRILGILGMEQPGLVLKRKLESLKANGIEHRQTKETINKELTEKYIVASMRYHELKTQLAGNIFKGIEREQIQNRIKVLEFRYPLISNHHFKTYKDLICSQLKTSCFPKKENEKETKALDSFLLEDKELEIADPRSYTAKIKNFLANTKDVKIKKMLNERMLDELQASFANQLTPLLSLKSMKECDLLNLHSSVSLEMINTSANPHRMFGKYCSCKGSGQVIDEKIVMGLEVASLGGLGLCLTPTGVGQVLGCPTAMVAGLGATGASAINFLDSMGRYQSIHEQKKIVNFFERNEFKKEEEERLKNKELQELKDMGVEGLTGLIGFGIGNVGMKNLVKYFKNGKLSLLIKKLSNDEKKRLEEAFEGLSPKDQTKAFVVLEKLDDESREVLVKNPTLVVKEFKKGMSCDL